MIVNLIGKNINPCSCAVCQGFVSNLKQILTLPKGFTDIITQNERIIKNMDILRKFEMLFISFTVLTADKGLVNYDGLNNSSKFNLINKHFHLNLFHYYVISRQKMKSKNYNNISRFDFAQNALPVDFVTCLNHYNKKFTDLVFKLSKFSPLKTMSIDHLQFIVNNDTYEMAFDLDSDLESFNKDIQNTFDACGEFNVKDSLLYKHMNRRQSPPLNSL